MKISPREADGFVKAPHVSCVLVYGPDQGQVRERSRALLVSVLGSDLNDPFRSAEVSGAAAAASAAALVDEAQALSLVGGRRAVRVTAAGDGVAEAVDAILKLRSGREAKSEALVVVEAGELGPRSTLRRLFEGSPDAASVPCYVDQDEQLIEFARAVLRALGHSVDPEALEWIAGATGGDRSVLRGELEKLSLFVGPGNPISAADAEACLGDTALLDLDDAVLAAATGDLSGLDQAMVRAYAAGHAPVTILRAVTREFIRLHAAAGVVAAGSSVDGALAQMRPPVFFRHKPAYQRALQVWKPDELGRALEMVLEAEVGCKTAAAADEAVAWRAVLRVATAAARRAP
ncbi:MAG: DNA polymerase III subunit delta [Alphaproteobacteria bacterium]|nr:DNA polymerase III subunit delta [Alphaproteobacteria bacterium]MBM4435898.1 DNA polymerase III subunit delta [Actinomycetota bacterium]